MWIAPHDPRAAPYRPTGALWVSLRTGLLHMALPDEGNPATPEFALKAAIEFGLKESKRLTGRPSTIEVRDPQLRQTLSDTMSALQTSVALVDDLPAVADSSQRSTTLRAGQWRGRRVCG